MSTDQKTRSDKRSLQGGVYDDAGYSPGLHDDLGTPPEQKADEVRQLERAHNSGGGEDEHDASRLRAKEENPREQYGPSARDDLQSKFGKSRERLGLGYTGDTDKMSPAARKRNKWYRSNSKIKKRLAIASAVGGTTAAGGLIAFFLMLPLKVVTLSKMFETQYMSQAYSVIEKTGTNMFSDYVRDSILVALDTGTCKTTASPKCVIVPTGTGPIGKLHAAWSKNKLENELAQKYGLIFGVHDGGAAGKQFYMSIDGKEVDLNEFRRSDMSLFDLTGNKQVSRSEIRLAIREALKGGTRWDRSYKRFVINRYLKRQLGIRYCLMRCDWVDGTSEKVDSSVANLKDKSLAFKVWTLQRAVPEKYQLIAGCFLDLNLCKTTLDPASPGDDLRASPAQKELQRITLAATQRFGQDKIDNLVKIATTREDGSSVSRAIIDVGLEKMFGKTAAQAAKGAIPGVNVVLYTADALNVINKAPNVLAHVAYAANVSTAVALAATYDTVASEQMSGNADAEIVGQANTSLTRDAPDSGEFASDATDTPLYQAIATNSGVAAPATTSALLSSFILPSAQALTPNGADTAHTLKYMCNNKEPVPANELECDDGKPAQRSELLDNFRKVACAIPGLCDLASAISTIVDSVFGTAFDAACTASLVCKPALEQMTKAIEKTGILKSMNDLLMRLFSLSNWRDDGGRKGNIYALGKDVQGNLIVRDSLGGMPATPEEIAVVRNEYIQAERKTFEKRPLVARIFSKDTEYSFVSQVSLRAPTTTDASMRNIASLLFSSPLERISNDIAGIYRTPPTYAATTNGAAIAAAFGTPQYTVRNIPPNPEAYWNTNCAQVYDESTGRLDKTDWLNNHTTGDEVFGQTNTQENPCMTIQAAFIALGAGFDQSLIPQESAPSAPGVPINTSDVFKSSVNIPCAEGSRDLGTQDGYNNGNKVPIRICAITGFRSGSAESSGGYGVIGAGGDLVLNSVASAGAVKLYKDATAAGIRVAASSGFRTMAHQQALWNQRPDRNFVAPPGNSNHQMGIAIDFDVRHAEGGTTCPSRATDPSEPLGLWPWLEKNAAGYGFKQYAAESWHWDMDPNPQTRCGGGS